MGPALDRLLASPSAIRLLRRVVRQDHAFACLQLPSPSARHCHSHPACPSQSLSLSPSPRPRNHPHPRCCSVPAVCSRRSVATLSHDHVQPVVQNTSQRKLDDKPNLAVPGDGKRATKNKKRNLESSTSPLPAGGLPATHRSHASSLWVLISYYAGPPPLGEDPFETVMHEADVANPSNRGRLVDEPEHAQNMQLWLELLRFRKRLHGHAGVQEIWSAMRLRNLDLPVHGSTADALWSTFIDSDLTDIPWLEGIYAHAKHLRQTAASTPPTLYRGLVGGMLRTTPRFAFSWHERMQADDMLPSDAALVAFPHVLQSKRGKQAVSAYKKIYPKGSVFGIYDLCMAKVCDSCDFATAMGWHNFFTHRDDHPSPAMLAKPLVRRLCAHAVLPDRQLKQEELSARTLLATSQSSSDTLLATPPDPHNAVNAIITDPHTVKQRSIGDAFCARLFATGAFSVDLVTTGLRMLGLDTLGPLALREIAARAQEPSDYLRTIESFETSGIAIVDCKFSRALEKFAKDGSSDYFNAIVQSDQHPDTYDDIAVQKMLFAEYLAAGKLVQAHATMSVLTMSESDPEYHTWNLLLQTYSKTSGHAHLLQILQDMRLKGIPLQTVSLNAIFYNSLRLDRKDLYTREGEVNLDFVTNVFLDVVRSGQEIPPHRWREILRRYGMTKRLLALERLLLWLLALYSKRPKPPAAYRNRLKNLGQYSSLSSTTARSGAEHTLRPLSEIFSPALLRAIVSWGFISAVPPLRHERDLRNPFPGKLPIASTITAKDKILPQRWAQGIAILRQLKDLGVDVTYTAVRREVKTRLWILFGPGRSAVRHNRLAQKLNRQPLLHYVKHINKIWRGNFFLLPRNHFGKATLSDHSPYTAVFGHEKRCTYHRDGIDGSHNRRRIRQRRGETDDPDIHSSRTKPKVSGAVGELGDLEEKHPDGTPTGGGQAKHTPHI